MSGSGNFTFAFTFEAFENVSKVLGKMSKKLEDFGGKTSGFNSKFQAASESTKNLRKHMHEAGEKITTVGEIMTIGITAPLALLKHKFREAGVESEESASKFGQVFKGVAAAAKGSAIADLRKEFSLSNRTAQDMLSTTGLFAKNLGFGETASLGMAKQVAGLSVQMANFRGHGVTAEQMSESLQAALLGNVRGLKAMGISISDAEVKQAALTAAQNGARFETVEQAKAAAILSIVQQKTTDDQEDYIESQGKLANQQRISKELFKDVSDSIGKMLMPAAERNTRIINGLQRAFLALSPAGQKVVVTMANIAGAIGPVLIVLGKFVGSVLPTMIKLYPILTSVSWAAVAPWAAWIAAIAAAIAVGYLLYRNWDVVKKFFVAFWDGPLGTLVKYLTPVGWLIQAATLIYKNWEPIKAFFGGLWDWVLQKMQPVLSAMGWIADKASSFGSYLLFGNNNPFAKKEGEGAPGAGGGVGAQANNIGAQAQAIGQGIVKEMRMTNDARVQIDFSNMPRGVSTSTQATGVPPIMNLGAMGGML